mgnify:CR=1 FL=1
MTFNEWGQLKKAVVGVADGAKIPPLTKDVRTVNYADKSDVSDVITGKYPQKVIDEANEDLEVLADFLQSESVEVVRPLTTENVEYYNFCPRDTVFTYGNRQLATPITLECRAEEWLHMLPVIPSIEIYTQGYYDDEMYNEDCVGNPDILALNEIAPMFDAANIIKANDHLLYLVSNTGNKAGAKILQEWLQNENITVHLLQGVYSYIHIDSTVAFLREGLLLYNPARIQSKDVLPEPFCNWDAIACPEPVDIGYHEPYCNASKWINMNLLSVNENLVCLEENQIPLAKELEKFGIDSKLLPMRHQRTLGGGFHCVTYYILTRQVRKSGPLFMII